MGALMTPASRFHNALRIMTSIEVDDLRAAGVIDENWGTPEASDRPQLAAFIQDPIRELLRMPDANFDKLFALIESWQPARNGPDAGTAHTPGPWSADADNESDLGEFTIRTSDGDYVADVRNPYCDYDMQVAYVASDDCRIEADARLIAAAPELLAELRSAESFIAGFENDELQEGVPDLLAGIRAAIAKAGVHTDG